MNGGFEKSIVECLINKSREIGVRYTIVFGSRAIEKHGSHSDYDVAVKVGVETSLRKRGFIYNAFEECIPPKSRLDVVFVDDWNPIIAWEALTKGVLIYSCGSECMSEYYNDKTRALDEVADLYPVIKRFEEVARNALSRISG